MDQFYSTGESFANWFYNTLNTNPSKVETIFNEYSVATIEGKEFQGKDENGKIKIMNYLTSEEAKKSRYMIVHFTVQPSIENCLLILVHGIVVPDYSKPTEDKSFDAAFFVHLGQKNHSFQLINYVYSISED